MKNPWSFLLAILIEVNFFNVLIWMYTQMRPQKKMNSHDVQDPIE